LFKYMVSFSRYFTVYITYQPPLVCIYICASVLYACHDKEPAISLGSNPQIGLLIANRTCCEWWKNWIFCILV